jgi:hypothetical protein
MDEISTLEHASNMIVKCQSLYAPKTKSDTSRNYDNPNESQNASMDVQKWSEFIVCFFHNYIWEEDFWLSTFLETYYLFNIFNELASKRFPIKLTRVPIVYGFDPRRRVDFNWECAATFHPFGWFRNQYTCKIESQIIITILDIEFRIHKLIRLASPPDLFDFMGYPQREVLVE